MRVDRSVTRNETLSAMLEVSRFNLKHTCILTTSSRGLTMELGHTGLKSHFQVELSTNSDQISDDEYPALNKCVGALDGGSPSSRMSNYEIAMSLVT